MLPFSGQTDGTLDPAFTQRNPYQTFLLALSIVASLPLLEGRSGSATLDRQLSSDAVIAWGAALLVGSALALAGSFWPGRFYSALLMERAGLLLVSPAAGIYAVAVLVGTANPAGVVYLVCVQVAYAAACGWRCWQIHQRVMWYRKHASGEA